ncbi:MAG: hypothetical protein AAF443_01295 [Chlamydiota bacterium]
MLYVSRAGNALKWVQRLGASQVKRLGTPTIIVGLACGMLAYLNMKNREASHCARDHFKLISYINISFLLTSFATIILFPVSYPVYQIRVIYIFSLASFGFLHGLKSSAYNEFQWINEDKQRRKLCKYQMRCFEGNVKEEIEKKQQQKLASTKNL